MTDDRSLERAARSWIEVGPTAAPPRVVDAALAIIERTPQERDWIPWRFPRMSSTARIAALIAVGALVLAGALALTGAGGRGGPAQSTAPSSSALASAAAAPSTSADPSSMENAARTPIPRPSAAIDEAGAKAAAERFQGYMNAGDVEAAADLVWPGAEIGGTYTFSRADVVTILRTVCGADHLGTWDDHRNVVHWDVKLKSRPGYVCPADGQHVETRFLVENGLIVEYRPIHARF